MYLEYQIGKFIVDLSCETISSFQIFSVVTFGLSHLMPLPTSSQFILCNPCSTGSETISMITVSSSSKNSSFAYLQLAKDYTRSRKKKKKKGSSSRYPKFLILWTNSSKLLHWHYLRETRRRDTSFPPTHHTTTFFGRFILFVRNNGLGTSHNWALLSFVGRDRRTWCGALPHVVNCRKLTFQG